MIESCNVTHVEVANLVGDHADRRRRYDGEDGEDSVDNGRLFDADAETFHVDGHVGKKSADTCKRSTTRHDTTTTTKAFKKKG